MFKIQYFLPALELDEQAQDDDGESGTPLLLTADVMAKNQKWGESGVYDCCKRLSTLPATTSGELYF